MEIDKTTDAERLAAIKRRLTTGFINPIWRRDIEWLVSRCEHLGSMLEMVERVERMSSSEQDTIIG